MKNRHAVLQPFPVCDLHFSYDNHRGRYVGDSIPESSCNDIGSQRCYCSDMKAFTADELQGKASELRRVISRESQALLTEGGEPVALLVPVDSATLDETAKAIQQARAQLALRSIRERSHRSGRNRMTIAQIDRVIANSRGARRRRGSTQEKLRS